jgi:hypothetical protein
MYGFNPSGDTSSNLAQNVNLRPLALDNDGRPSRLVMVRATHTAAGATRSIIAFNALRDALSRINWNESPTSLPLPPGISPAMPTRWIGPMPRVVRRGSDLAARQEMDVAWPLLLEPQAGFSDASVAAAQQNRKLLIERQIARISGSPDEPAGGWSGVSLVPYAEAVHGPLSWWQSGYAGRTRTFERQPTATEVDMQENPQGPDAADLQNPDYLSWLRDNFVPGGGFSWGLLLGGVVVAGGLLYAISKSSGREVVVRAEGRGGRST